MKFLNTTKNTVQLDDIDLSIPYNNGIEQFIDSQSVKKSLAFQKMVSLGGFTVVEANNDRLEQNLLYYSKNKIEPLIEENIRQSSGPKIEAILRGHFYESSGYAKVNRNLALNLFRQGIVVEIEPVSTRNNDLNEVEARMLSFMKNPVGKDAVFIDSVIPTHGKVSKQNYNILYTTAESLVPSLFIEIANQYNEIWVTSSFSKKAFQSSGFEKKITIVPPIVNKNLYHENVQPYVFDRVSKSFLFSSVMTWGYRKGSEVLIRSFCEAFTKYDDAGLVLLISERSKIKQVEIKKEIQRIKSEYTDAPAIHCCMKNIPEYQMPSFYKACHAFVLPSRGEGFGLPYCEASLCGLPVISTRYGGQLDFLTDENSLLVNIDSLERTEQGQTGVHYWDRQFFPKLTSDSFINELAESLRFVYRNYDLSKSKNKLLQEKIISSFSGEIVGFQVKTLLNKIWSR